MSDTEFRLEVGESYVARTGELHVCVEHNEKLDVFRCEGERTGDGWYFPTGQVYVGENAKVAELLHPHMTLQPVTP